VRKHAYIPLLLVFVFTCLAAGCSRERDPGRIRLGVLPDINSAPFVIAAEEGIFEESGVDVEIVYFNSARERDQALQAGAIEGANSDILSVIFLNDGGFPVKATSLTEGSYTIVAAAGRDYHSAADLRGAKVGLSQNTIIEFVIDRILENYGLHPDDIEKEYIMDMPLRREMLLAGQIDAAGLPEPLGSLSVARGGSLVAESNEEGIMPGILLFRQEVLVEQAGEIQKFYQGYSRAIELMNQEISGYLPLLVEKLKFPEELLDSYTFPCYSEPELPDKMEVDAALQWLAARKLIHGEYAYDDLIAEGFLKVND
jgi:NitT/TauT family transport system substrate-binding protein